MGKKISALALITLCINFVSDISFAETVERKWEKVFTAGPDAGRDANAIFYIDQSSITSEFPVREFTLLIDYPEAFLIDGNSVKSMIMKSQINCKSLLTRITTIELMSEKNGLGEKVAVHEGTDWSELSGEDKKNFSPKVCQKNIENFKESKFKKDRRINLKISNSQPLSDGSFAVSIQTNADTASLKINGEELGGRADGSYTISRVALAGQETKLEIVAIDVYGNTDTKTITVSRPITDSKPIVAALNPAQVKRQPERDAVAIIIGISDYINLPRADYANDDARVFYDYAIRALGVKPENIRLLVDADADDVAIYRAFKTWLPSKVRASTDVYVYYGGHGLPTADGQGIYLLPQRADRDFIDKTAITQAEINAAIQAAKPKSVTVFLDSCYSGQARSGETLIASARPVVLKAEKQLFPDNFTVITASQADQISSSSPDLKHGIFSYYLMRGMEGDADVNQDGKITAGEMHQYLTEQVARQAGMMNRRQQPQLTGDANRVLVGRQ
jgi:hypothetical protein